MKSPSKYTVEVIGSLWLVRNGATGVAVTEGPLPYDPDARLDLALHHARAAETDAEVHTAMGGWMNMPAAEAEKEIEQIMAGNGETT